MFTGKAAAWKYANLIRNKAKRDYANAYINWMRNGAEGLEPEAWQAVVYGGASRAAGNFGHDGP